jgi:hypothetical protein
MQPKRGERARRTVLRKLVPRQGRQWSCTEACDWDTSFHPPARRRKRIYPEGFFGEKFVSSLETRAMRMYACSAEGLCIWAATEFAAKVSGLGRRWVPKSGTADRIRDVACTTISMR